MPPRAPPKSSPLARLLEPSLEYVSLRLVSEEVLTYAHAVVFKPAATPVDNDPSVLIVAEFSMYAFEPTYNIRGMRGS